MKLKDMEAPAKLTTIRLALIPLFMLFTVYDFGMDSLGKYTWPRIIAASFFILACIVYFVDKRLMKGRDITKGFWCFLDVVADKLVVFGALLSICFSDYVLPDGFYRHFFFWSTAVIVLRELFVIGICLTDATMSVDYLFEERKWQRLLIKTTAYLQLLCIAVVLLEPIFFSHTVFCDFRLLSLIVTVATVALAVCSGLYSIVAYKNHVYGKSREDSSKGNNN